VVLALDPTCQTMKMSLKMKIWIAFDIQIIGQSIYHSRDLSWDSEIGGQDINPPGDSHAVRKAPWGSGCLSTRLHSTVSIFVVKTRQDLWLGVGTSSLFPGFRGKGCVLHFRVRT